MLAAKTPDIDARTYDSYSGGLSQLLAYLGPRADAPIGGLTKAEFMACRNSLSSTVSATTTNNHLALVKMLFKSARRDIVCSDNPVEFIGYVRATGRKAKEKRPFTLGELQAILAVAGPEWRSLILFGLYTGQRLSDLVSLTWNNIDLERGEVRLVTSKTSRTMIIPMAPPLRSHIESLTAGDRPEDPLHPRAFSILSRTGKPGALSNAFSDLLVQAGLRAKPAYVNHRGGRVGHSARRKNQRALLSQSAQDGNNTAARGKSAKHRSPGPNRPR